MTHASQELSGDASPGEELPVVAEHIPMANRLSLISWGDGSVPPMPSIDDDTSPVG